MIVITITAYALDVNITTVAQIYAINMHLQNNRKQC